MAAPVTTVAFRDLDELLTPEPGLRQPLAGFDEDYVDIVDYIIRCTYRIWEQKDLGLIYTHYAPDVAIHTLTGDVSGIESVVENTAKTLAAFPDRTLAGDNVVWSGDDQAGFYSSHRITSLLTNLGASDFGPATGRRACITTIADCAVKANRIYEEWLVRDNLALVLQLGFDPRAVAATQAAADRARSESPSAARLADIERVRASAATTVAPLPAPADDDFPEAWAESAINARMFGRLAERYSPAARMLAPGGRHLLGRAEITGWWFELVGALPDARVIVEHVAAVPFGERGRDVAIRWLLAGRHTGIGRYGAPSGRDVLILGCTHWRVVDGQITDDWTVFDDLAVLRQVAGGL